MPDFEAGFRVAGLIRSPASRNHSAENPDPRKSKARHKGRDHAGNLETRNSELPKNQADRQVKTLFSLTG